MQGYKDTRIMNAGIRGYKDNGYMETRIQG